MFLVSSSFHTYSTVRRLSPVLRMLDHSAIVVGLGVTATTDMAVATLDFRNVPWQCAVDSIGVALVLLLWPLVVLYILFEWSTASLGLGIAGLLCC